MCDLRYVRFFSRLRSFAPSLLRPSLLRAGLLKLMFLAASPIAARAAEPSPAAPGAGGYASDYGSDYGVGRTRRPVIRQPVAVIGLRARTMGGTLQPWAGLRFGDALSRRLEPLMGRAPSSGALARTLAANGMRAQDVGSPWPRTARSALAQRALTILQPILQPAMRLQPASAVAPDEADAADVPLERSALTLLGDMVLGGPITQPGASLSVTVSVLRVWDAPSRPDGIGIETVLPAVTVQAPARDWAQLPARTALAVLDGLQIALTENERVALLRDASPLMPAATARRLTMERRLGEAVAAAIDARCAQMQSRRATSSSARRRLLSRAVQQGKRALKELRLVAASPVPTGAAERAAMVALARSARDWLASTALTVQESRRHLRAAPVQRNTPR